jgi:hypothetical protein
MEERTNQEQGGKAKGHFTFLGVVLSIVAYGLSLTVVGWLIVALAFYLAETVNENSIVPYVVPGLALLLYTVGFFYLVRRTVIKRAERREFVSQPKKDMVRKSQVDRSQDRSTKLLLRVGLLLAALFVLPWIISFLMGFVGNEKYVFPVMVLSGLLVMMFFTFLSRRKLMLKRSDRVVLWLRRFHEDGLFPFELMLEDVCRGIALPLTVADTTVPASRMAGLMHPLWLAGVGMLGLAYLGGFSLFSIWSLPQVALFAVPMGLAGGALMMLGKRAGGQSDLRTHHGKEVLEKIFHAIDQNIPIASAMTVVRMSDEDWKTWVGGFIERSDAVIMDVTHLTDSLGWELNACKENLAPAGMILACGWYDDTDDDPWPALEPKLEKFLGADYLASCQRFNYKRPRKDKIWAPLRSNREWRAKRMCKEYEKPLLACFSAAFESKR